MKAVSRTTGQASSAGAPSRGQSRNGPREALLHLQVTAGNRAVSKLLTSGLTSSSAPVGSVQRNLEYDTSWTVSSWLIFSKWAEGAGEVWAEIQPAFDNELAPALKRLSEFKKARLLDKKSTNKVSKLLDWLKFDTEKISLMDGKKLKKQHEKLLSQANGLVEGSITALQERLRGSGGPDGHGDLEAALADALGRADSISADEVRALAGRVGKLEEHKVKAVIPTEETTFTYSGSSSSSSSSAGSSRKYVPPDFTEKVAQQFVKDHPPAPGELKFTTYTARVSHALHNSGYGPKAHKGLLEDAWSKAKVELGKGEGKAFDPADPGTWKGAINEVKYAEGVSEADVLAYYDGAALLGKIKDGTARGNTRGDDTAAARATPAGARFHGHLLGGHAGLSWAYFLGETNRVTPYIYDIAPSRTKKEEYRWKLGGGTSNTTSGAEFA